MAEQPIQNCELRFQFKCPKQWDALQETAEAGVRFCGECHKQVYLCQDTREAARHARAGHCVAVPAGLVSPMHGHEIDPDLLRLVPLELALKYGAVPLRREGTSIVVAMSDLNTPHAVDDLIFVSGYNIEVVLASRQDLQEALERAHREQTRQLQIEMGVVCCQEPEPDAFDGVAGKTTAPGEEVLLKRLP